MKRFVPLFVALVLSIPVTGCDTGSSGSPTAAAVPAANDPHVPGEAKKYRDGEAERLAKRAAEISRAKPGKLTSHHR